MSHLMKIIPIFENSRRQTDAILKTVISPQFSEKSQ